MSPAGAPTSTSALTALRHRRDARLLSTAQLADFRSAISQAQAISDDRGYQYWAGIHGLPLPIYCQHHTHLFLPWHRAYLYFFEKNLQDRVPGVTLPWWNWIGQSALPEPYAAKRAGGNANPLYDSPIQPSARDEPRIKRTERQTGKDGVLPSQQHVDAALANPDFFTFQTQLSSIHDGVHMWVGGTMGDVYVAAYDPIFFAHHCMIDRLWYLWQLEHPGAQPPANLLDRALPPFPMTVRDTLDISHLGYDYAATTVAAAGPGHHG
jgi:tyrosinase